VDGHGKYASTTSAGNTFNAQVIGAETRLPGTVTVKTGKSESEKCDKGQQAGNGDVDGYFECQDYARRTFQF
jgi:hypothetical protein